MKLKNNKQWLISSVYINAWLNRYTPFISIHEKESGKILAHFDSSIVNSFIDNGEISIEDLQSTDKKIQGEVIADLFVLYSKKTVKIQTRSIGSIMQKSSSKIRNTPPLREHNNFEARA